MLQSTTDELSALAAEIADDPDPLGGITFEELARYARTWDVARAATWAELALYMKDWNELARAAGNPDA
jgi:hypothetical protein